MTCNPTLRTPTYHYGLPTFPHLITTTPYTCVHSPHYRPPHTRYRVAGDTSVCYRAAVRTRHAPHYTVHLYTFPPHCYPTATHCIAPTMHSLPPHHACVSGGSRLVDLRYVTILVVTIVACDSLILCGSFTRVPVYGWVTGWIAVCLLSDPFLDAARFVPARVAGCSFYTLFLRLRTAPAARGPTRLMPVGYLPPFTRTLHAHARIVLHRSHRLPTPRTFWLPRTYHHGYIFHRLHATVPAPLPTYLRHLLHPYDPTTYGCYVVEIFCSFGKTLRLSLRFTPVTCYVTTLLMRTSLRILFVLHLRCWVPRRAIFTPATPVTPVYARHSRYHLYISYITTLLFHSFVYHYHTFPSPVLFVYRFALPFGVPQLRSICSLRSRSTFRCTRCVVPTRYYVRLSHRSLVRRWAVPRSLLPC